MLRYVCDDTTGSIVRAVCGMRRVCGRVTPNEMPGLLTKLE